MSGLVPWTAPAPATGASPDAPGLSTGGVTGGGGSIPVPPDTVFVDAWVVAPADTLSLGAPFEAVVELVHPGLEGIELLNPVPELGDFELSGMTRGLDHGDTAQVVLTLRPWQVGELRLEPLLLSAYGGEDELCLAMTDSVSIQVASIVPADATTPEGLHEPVEVPGPVPWLAIGAAGLALLVALLLWQALRRRGGDAVATGTRARPAHELALEAIDALAGSDLARMGPWKTFYTELSDILRHYLVRRYGVDAPDLTTHETFRALREVEVPDDASRALRDVLDEADRVKFAKAEPAAEAPSRALHRAREMVTLSAPAPAPEPEADAAPGAPVPGSSGGRG